MEKHESDRRQWEPMRLEAVGSLGTVISSATGSINDAQMMNPVGMTQLK